MAGTDLKTALALTIHLARMRPFVGRDPARFGQLDHVDRRRAASVLPL
jgi:hypothetical protein